MKIQMFLIVLDLIQMCVGFQAKISIDDGPRDNITRCDWFFEQAAVAVSRIHTPVALTLTAPLHNGPLFAIDVLRDKRELSEYTRWSTNHEPKREFIVKVEEDAFSPSTASMTPPVVGINIQTGTKAGRIIVGGAIVPQPTPQPVNYDTSAVVEYTRFVPPTTVRTTVGNNVNMGMRIKPENVAPFSVVKHPHRDESPPSGPQFLTKVPGLAELQYVPLSAVGFHPPKTTPGPLTPPSLTTTKIPTRSDPLPLSKITRATYTETRLLSEDENELKSFLAPIAREFENDIMTPETSTEIVTSFSIWNDDTETTGKQTSTLDFDLIYGENDIERNKKAKEGTPDDASDDIKNGAAKEESEEGGNDNNIYTNINESGRRQNDNYKDLSLQSNIDSNVISEKRPIFKVNSRPRKPVELKRHAVCSLLKLRPLRFDTPLTLQEIMLQLKKWADSSPVTKLIDITASNLTTMDNPIYMMKVDDPSSGQVASAKEVVLLVAGIQGRDHHAVTAAVYVLFQLIERTDAHADLLKKYRFWIIPVFNPDGYDYSMTFTERREWTKNLQQSWEPSTNDRDEPSNECETYGLRCLIQPCYGVHLDRNFEYQWIPAEELKAEHPCGNLYAGSRQLSEPETRALTTFLHAQETPISIFVAFKEGDVLGVMYPYSHTKKKRAFDGSYRKRSSRAASAAFTISGRPYVAGQTSEFLPLYAGGIEDWVDGHLGIDNTYTIMMFRPTDSYNSKLITEHVVHEAYAAFDTLLMEPQEPLEVDAMKPLVMAKKSSGPEKMKNLVESTLVLSVTIFIFIS